jgi:endoglucanase
LLVIDQAIEWAAMNDLYVIIDYHGLGFPPDGYDHQEFASTTVEEMIQFWEIVPARYAGNSTVAFYQYYNEPMRDNSRSLILGDWLIWKEFSEQMIDVIRQHDPDTIIIVSGMKGGNDLSFALDAPIERDNIAYEAHPFPGQARWCPWDRCFGEVSEVYPVIVEFGFDNDPAADHFIQESSYVGAGLYREGIIAYVEERGLSWTTWVFSHDWTPRMLLDTNFTPSEFGLFVQEQLLSHMDQ